MKRKIKDPDIMRFKQMVDAIGGDLRTGPHRGHFSPCAADWLTICTHSGAFAGQVRLDEDAKSVVLRTRCESSNLVEWIAVDVRAIVAVSRVGLLAPDDYDDYIW